MARLRDGLEEIETAADNAPEPMTIGPLEVEGAETSLWPALAVGLAIGVAAAALLVATLSRRRRETAEGGDQNRARSAAA